VPPEPDQDRDPQILGEERQAFSHSVCRMNILTANQNAPRSQLQGAF
jgi:hypothetical protein